MRAYKVTAVEMDDGEEFVLGTRYAGTNADARTTRDELMEQFGLKKKDVTIEDAEIPTAKAELLAFINTLLAEMDYSDDGEDS